MIKKILGFIFRLILIAVIIGVPCAWMIRRFYNNPEVHYYEREEQKGIEKRGLPDWLRRNEEDILLLK